MREIKFRGIHVSYIKTTGDPPVSKKPFMHHGGP